MIFPLTKAALKMFIRNRQALFFTLFMPIIIMVIFGLVGFDRLQPFEVGLVSPNPDAATQQFIIQMKSFGVFKIHEGTLDVELKDLKDGNLVAVIAVPDDFMSQASAENAPTKSKELTVYINESKQTEAQAVTSILNQYLDKTTLTIVHAPTFFSVRQEIVDAKQFKYMDFLLPGLIGMAVMQMAVFSVAFVFVQYKEKGVLKRLLATPMQPGSFVAANVITRLFVSVVQTAIFIAIGVLFFGAHVVGPYWLVLLCVVLGALMFLGLGFTVSGVSTTVDSVPAIANLIVFPMLFLGGVFFPITGMPHWLQVFAKLLPLTHFSSALRIVMTQSDATLSTIKFDLLAMTAWSVLFIALATITFGFQEKDN